MRDFIFYQLFEAESSTYTYIVGDTDSREVVIIDPVLETVERDLLFILQAGLKLKYILETHLHADHITGAGNIRKQTGVQTAMSARAGVDCADIFLKDGAEIFLGKQKIKVLETPGHTDSCVSYLFRDMIFSGDALLIRGCGRTDFQQGSSRKLFASVHEKIFTLPPETIVYPAHDYRGQTASTVELEIKFNPRLGMGRTEAEFIQIMSDLKLALPKKIHEALPANMACGRSKE